MDDEVRLQGAAAIPGDFSQLHLSYNLAGLVADDVRVQVYVRKRLYARFFALVGLAKIDENDPKSEYGWAANWADIDHVVTSEKSVIFYPGGGSRGCRFATARRRTIQPLFAMIDARGISRERVASTIGRGYRL